MPMRFYQKVGHYDNRALNMTAKYLKLFDNNFIRNKKDVVTTIKIMNNGFELSQEFSLVSLDHKFVSGIKTYETSVGLGKKEDGRQTFICCTSA